MSKSTAKRAGGKGTVAKPKKPYPDFPLFAHATGRWAKKIRGKFVYFGKWDDPDAALTKYLDEKDDLHAGRTPRVIRDGLTIRDLLNRFLTAKRHLVDTRELTHRTFADYHATCVRLKDATRNNPRSSSGCFRKRPSGRIGGQRAAGGISIEGHSLPGPLIDAVHVTPERRGEGIRTELLIKALEFFRERGTTSIHILLRV